MLNPKTNTNAQRMSFLSHLLRSVVRTFARDCYNFPPAGAARFRGKSQSVESEKKMYRIYSYLLTGECALCLLVFTVCGISCVWLQIVLGCLWK